MSRKLLTSLLTLLMLGALAAAQAGEKQIVLRDHLNKQWTQELLTYPFSAPRGQCHRYSLTLTDPQGRPVPVQLSDVELWPGTHSVKAAKLSFIADLVPLAADTYTVRYGGKPSTTAPPATDLKLAPGKDQVEITTGQFGARLLLGEKTYAESVAATEVPGPVKALRMGDGTWFGGSAMYGPGKLMGCSAKLTDAGPVFARVTVRWTYENGNTMDLAMRVVAGDNTMRMETRVAQDQPKDGFSLVVSRGLPPLIFQVRNENCRDREAFRDAQGGYGSPWADLPLKDYVAPDDKTFWSPLRIAKAQGELVTTLSPWEDWFGTFTQTRIRLKLQDTARELQIRSLDPGAWVEPREIESIFDPDLAPDPQQGLWVGWNQKCVPLLREGSGEIMLQVNAAQGVRKWTVSDCLSVPGGDGLYQWYNDKLEDPLPPEARPTVGALLDEVKDDVLDWPGDAGKHPRLFMSRAELEARWRRQDADPAELKKLLEYGNAPTPDSMPKTPNWSYTTALGAYLVSGGSPESVAKTQLLARLHKMLQYDLWGVQFGCAGSPAPIFYDALIDSPVVPETERPVFRARMAYYAYRLADPAVWSAERGYASGNQNMTVTWEISRGITACAIPEHPMARAWFQKAERIMEQFLNHMVGPAGEWPEAMGDHGRQSVDMILSFALASTNSGLHDYANDSRLKRLILWWAKMETPRDPRPRGGIDREARPGLRYFPAMGRDRMGGAGATCGVMARMTSKSDPEYSAAMQWAWQEEGASQRLAHLGGFAFLSCDDRLPAKRPAWTSEVFPYTGAVLRHGLGTPDEHQVVLYSGDHFAAFYPGHAGSFPNLFAFGVPVAGTWPGPYEDQDELFQCHVALAHGVGTLEERKAVAGHVGSAQNAPMWGWPEGQKARFGEHGGTANVSSFSALPRQDYAAVDVALHYPRAMQLNWLTDLPAWPPVPAPGKPPVDWRRQALFLKDDDPAQATYLLLRDSVKGGQPTMWQMWTVSESLDTPEKVKDVAAVLANRPGNKVVPVRELQGDRFTAIGQLGVEVEYYVAAPSDTPRYTMRWGTDQAFQTAIKLVQPEYQDLLHLQMPGDGVYFVAFYPRKRDWPAPTFSTLGDGLIIKVSGDFGTDYGFLSALEAAAAGEGATFRGTAASIQDRRSGLALTLGAQGEVRYKAYGLSAGFPVSLRVREKALTVELPAGLQPAAFGMMQPFPGGTVTVNAPGNWALAQPRPGAKLAKTAAGWLLSVPPGLTSLTLTALER